jgi:hypothetical protein
MGIVLLASLLMLADDEKEFVEHLTVLADSQSSGLLRNSALLAIAKLKKIDDPRLTNAYESFLKYGPNEYMPAGEYRQRVGILLEEVCDDRFYARGNFLLAAKLIRQDTGRSPHFLRRAYLIRSKWWQDKEILSILTDAVTGGKNPRDGYNPFSTNEVAKEKAPYKEYEADRLRGWTNYCYNLAYLGNGELEDLWKRGLADKRGIGDMGRMASLPQNPIPLRLCDHCLTFLLIRHGVEPHKVLEEYNRGQVGRAGLVGGGGLPAAKRANAAAYDAAIKDYDAIAKRYFR